MEERIITAGDSYKVYNTGIEQEEDDQPNMDPFDPEEISIDTKLVSMETCLRRLIQGTIALNPDFQRKEVWTLDKKSQLIESLMLKIPLPMFYVSADEKSNYTVVDGLQRLSTIRSFILGDNYLETKKEADSSELTITNSPDIEGLRGNGFLLANLEFWHEYNGRNFNALPINIKNRILETEFRFTVINPGTPEEVRRNIFKRLNTGGMPLSSQEIRNALYLGQATTLLNELSEYPEFKEATANSIKSLRMEDKELILRLLSFLVRDYKTYRKTISIDNYLSDTMIILNAFPSLNTRDFQKAVKNRNLDLSDITVMSFDEIRKRFIDAMKRAYIIFGKHTFRKSFGDDYRSAINKGLFETWGVILANLSKIEFETLQSNRQIFLKDYIPIIMDYEFQVAISRDSMKTASVKTRFEKFNNLVKKYIS